MKLKNFFNPSTIAIIGASSDKKKIGRQILDNVIKSGFSGKIYPVNLKGGKIAKQKVLIDLEKIPQKYLSSTLVVIAIPAIFVVKEVEKCGRLGIKNIIIISAGFKEFDKEGAYREKKLAILVKKYQLNILGPNCLGFINNVFKINASFAKSSIGSGRIALLSQSGAIGSAALDWLMSKHLNFGYFISLGNKSFLNENDFLHYLAHDKNIDAIVFYLEEINDGLKFIELTSSLASQKPIIVLTSGLSKASQEIIKSHTGALAGTKEAVLAGLKRGRVIRVETLEDVFSLLLMIGDGKNFLNKIKNIRNREINIITNAGGLAALTADLAAQENITIKESVDILGDADVDKYQVAVARLIKKYPKTSILVLLTPQAQTQPQAVAEKIFYYSQKNKKIFITTVFVGGNSVAPANDWLHKRGIPAFSFPVTAICAFKYLFLYQDLSFNLQPVYKKRSSLQIKLNKKLMLTPDTKLVDHLESFNLLKKYKIPTVVTRAYSKQEKFNFPAVLKITGADFIHKTDKQAIFLNLKNQKELEDKVSLCQRKHKKFLQSARNYLVVQPQINTQLELIIGLKYDHTFGHILLFGLGGIYSEVFKKIDITLAQLNKGEALRFIKELPFFSILNGIRGQQKYNLDKLAEILVNLCQMVADYPEIQELDINPLFLNKSDLLAGDIRIFIR